MTDPAVRGTPASHGFPAPASAAPRAGGASWLRAVLPGPGGPRGPRDPLSPEETEDLWRSVHEALSGLSFKTSVFVRRDGSLKVVPFHLAGSDEALVLQLARIANALRGAGLSAWWTDSGITPGPGPSAPSRPRTWPPSSWTTVSGTARRSPAR